MEGKNVRGYWGKRESGIECGGRIECEYVPRVVSER
jgi:hypothetical protein